MANPNIVNVATITAHTKGQEATTSLADMLDNTASSGKVFKVNSVVASNIDGTNDADVTIVWRDTANAEHSLATNVTVPAKSTLVVIEKGNSIYMTEDSQIAIQASANGDIDVVISYEEIS